MCGILGQNHGGHHKHVHVGEHIILFWNNEYECKRLTQPISADQNVEINDWRLISFLIYRWSLSIFGWNVSILVRWNILTRFALLLTFVGDLCNTQYFLPISSLQLVWICISSALVFATLKLLHNTPGFWTKTKFSSLDFCFVFFLWKSAKDNIGEICKPLWRHYCN